MRNPISELGPISRALIVITLAVFCIAFWPKSAESAERFFLDGVENLSFPAFIDGLKACRNDGNGPGSGCHLRVTYARYSQILQENGNVPSEVDVIEWLEENTKVGKPKGELPLYGIEDGEKLVTNTRSPRRGEMIVYNKSEVPILSLNCANPFPKVDMPVTLPSKPMKRVRGERKVVRQSNESVWVTTWGTSSHSWGGYGGQNSQWSIQNSHRRFH